MHDTYIDINNAEHQRDVARQRFLNDEQISDHNKAIIQRYLRDASLGKTLVHRAKKTIGPARQHIYLTHLTTFIYYVGKDLNQVSQDDMEAFIEALDTNHIRSRQLLQAAPQ